MGGRGSISGSGTGSTGRPPKVGGTRWLNLNIADAFAAEDEPIDESTENALVGIATIGLLYVGAGLAVKAVEAATELLTFYAARAVTTRALTGVLEKITADSTLAVDVIKTERIYKNLKYISDDALLAAKESATRIIVNIERSEDTVSAELATKVLLKRINKEAYRRGLVDKYGDLL